MERILFFDGHCHLCDGFVDFLIQHDQAGHFYFASLQGKTAKAKLGNFSGMQVNLQNPETLIYLRDGKLLLRSQGALQILRDLQPRPWFVVPFLFAGFLMPTALADLIYNYVARNRYRWFGQKEICRIPSPEDKNRLLD